MNIWVSVRLALVALALIQGALSDQVVAPQGSISVSLLVTVFVFGVLSMLFVVGIQRINPQSAPVWRFPRWSINPFLMREPLQFFHLGGFFFIAVGIGSAMRLLALGQNMPASVLFTPAVGAGVLLGVHLCTLVYRGKMERTQHLYDRTLSRGKSKTKLLLKAAVINGVGPANR